MRNCGGIMPWMPDSRQKEKVAVLVDRHPEFSKFKGQQATAADRYIEAQTMPKPGVPGQNINTYLNNRLKEAGVDPNNLPNNSARSTSPDPDPYSASAPARANGGVCSGAFKAACERVHGGIEGVQNRIASTVQSGIQAQEDFRNESTAMRRAMIDRVVDGLPQSEPAAAPSMNPARRI